MAEANLDKSLAGLVEQSRRDSIGSIDHFVNARAIALADPKVQLAITEVLGRGMRLTEIRPLRGFGSSLMSFPLQFVFRSGKDDSSIDLAIGSLVVTVELPMRAVKRIALGPPSGEAMASDVPFAIAASARPPYAPVPFSDLEGRYRRERAYFDAVGIPEAGRRPSPGQWTIDDHKTTDSVSGCESWCETLSSGTVDDSEADDTVGDDQDVDDHITEGHPGDPTAWSPFDPGRPFGTFPPRGPIDPLRGRPTWRRQR